VRRGRTNDRALSVRRKIAGGAEFSREIFSLDAPGVVAF
jgi:hypothetical protein